jgi:hypothetical protein
LNYEEGHFSAGSLQFMSNPLGKAHIAAYLSTTKTLLLTIKPSAARPVRRVLAFIYLIRLCKERHPVTGSIGRAIALI